VTFALAKSWWFLDAAHVLTTAEPKERDSRASYRSFLYSKDSKKATFSAAAFRDTSKDAPPPLLSSECPPPLRLPIN
jgi:hypothetical protein